jgi:hypothetical protein
VVGVSVVVVVVGSVVVVVVVGSVVVVVVVVGSVVVVVVGGFVVDDPPAVVLVVPVPGLVVPLLPGPEVPALPMGTTSPSTTVEPGGRGTTTSSPVSGSMMRAVTGAGRMIWPVPVNDTATAGWLGGIVVAALSSPIAIRWVRAAASSSPVVPPSALIRANPTASTTKAPAMSVPTCA